MRAILVFYSLSAKSQQTVSPQTTTFGGREKTAEAGDLTHVESVVRLPACLLGRWAKSAHYKEAENWINIGVKRLLGCGLWTLSCDFVHHLLLKY